ncbi:MAG: metal ABC transporter solute-binding protein, Zn/Mn family [Patescibacteria group bacterium]
MMRQVILRRWLTVTLPLLSIFLLWLFWQISKNPTNTYQNQQDLVCVSIAPQKFFVEKIAGDTLKVHVMVSEGFSPETYEPTAQDLQTLLKSQVIFSLGQLAFEKTTLPQLLKSNPEIRLVDTSEKITLKNFDLEVFDAETGKDLDHRNFEINDQQNHKPSQEQSLEVSDNHQLSNDHEHDHIGQADPHIWLSPRLVKQQVEAIYQTLIELKPENTDLYLMNKNSFFAELDQLDQELKNSFDQLQNKNILVYHPAFGYLADDYGLRQISIEIEGKEPSVQQVQKVITFAKEHKIQTVFVQKQFDDRSAKTIAKEIDGQVVALDPLSENYLENLRTIAQLIDQQHVNEK